MIQIHHNNYINHWGTGPEWRFTMERCTEKQVGRYRDELVRAARIIYDQATSPITLMYSGGTDSEYMLHVFNTAKVPYNVAIIRLGNYNWHDIVYAIKHCERYNITPTIVDVDAEHFVKSGKMLEIAKQINCWAYQYTSTLYGITKLDGTILLATNEPRIIKKENNEWFFEERENNNNIVNWYKQESIDGTPDFLRYTPESVLACLEEQVNVDLCMGKYPKKLANRSSKIKIYSEHYPIEGRTKYHGWEKLKEEAFFKELAAEEINELYQKHNGIIEVYHETWKDSLRYKD